MRKVIPDQNLKASKKCDWRYLIKLVYRANDQPRIAFPTVTTSLDRMVQRVADAHHEISEAYIARIEGYTKRARAKRLTGGNYNRYFNEIYFCGIPRDDRNLFEVVNHEIFHWLMRKSFGKKASAGIDELRAKYRKLHDSLMGYWNERQ